MTTRGVFAVTALALICAASPALADGWSEGHGDRWYAVHRDIYELENRIARLEADPKMDDGYRAPIIEAARREIRRLRGNASARLLALDRPVLLRPQADPPSLNTPPPFVRLTLA